MKVNNYKISKVGMKLFLPLLTIGISRYLLNVTNFVILTK